MASEISAVLKLLQITVSHHAVISFNLQTLNDLVTIEQNKLHLPCQFAIWLVGPIENEIVMYSATFFVCKTNFLLIPNSRHIPRLFSENYQIYRRDFVS